MGSMFKVSDEERFRGASFALGDRMGPAATFDDVAETTYQDIKASGEVLSRRRALERAYDDAADRIFAATGQRFEAGNPMRAPAIEMRDGVRVPVDRRRRANDFEVWRRTIAEQHPDKAYQIRPDVPVEQDAYRLTQGAEQRARDTWDRSDKGLSAYAAWAWGNLKAAATDPVNILTAPIGGGLAGVGAKAVVWAGVKSAAANMAVETGVQPFVQSWRGEAGLDHGVSQAAMSIAAAGAFGFVADAGVRSASRGVRQVIGHVPVLDATGRVTGWRSPTERPLEALDLAARQRPPEDVLARASAGDLDAMREVARTTGADAEPEMRAALDAAEADLPLEIVPQGMRASDHVGHMQDFINAVDGDELVPSVIIRAGEVTASEERLTEVFARDVVDIASELRSSSAFRAEKLPWSEPHLRPAVMLARADRALFEAVQGKRISPHVAAVVAEYVPDRARHLDLAEAVAAGRPKTPAEAKDLLRDALKRPVSADEHVRIAGGTAEPPTRTPLKIDDPRGADGAAHLDTLRRRHQARAKTRAAEPNAITKSVTPETDAKVRLREVQAAIADAEWRLPQGVTIRSFSDLADLPALQRRDAARAEAEAGLTPEGLTDAATGDIWIARDALDPAGTLHHETVHALVARGVMSDADLATLSKVARDTPGLYDRARYEDVYRGLPDGDRALMEEDAAHVYQAWKAGRSFKQEAVTIFKRIANVLERVRNKLKGRGFYTDVDAVLRDIDTGTMAKRQSGAGGKGSRFALRGYRPRPNERELRIGALNRRVASWLGVEARQFQVDPVYIAAKRAEHAKVGGYELSPHFATPEATRDFVEATISTAEFARRRDANTWNLMSPQADGSVHLVSIKTDPNDMGYYFVKTAFVANEADTLRGLVGTMRAFGAAGLRVGSAPGAYRRFLAYVSQSARTVPGRDFDSIVAEFAQDLPIYDVSAEGATRFALKLQSSADLRVDMLAASRAVDAKARQQAERVAYLDEEVRTENERMILAFRDARGQADPLKFISMRLEGHGEVVMPEGFQSVAGLQKALEGRYKSRLEDLLFEFRPKFLTGQSQNAARLDNVLREVTGVDTGDATAKAFANAWRALLEEVRQEANAAGADIGKLDDFFLPQVHTREALLVAGKSDWVSDIERGLDVPRILRENRDPASAATKAAANADFGTKWKSLEAEKVAKRQEIAARRDEAMAAHKDAASAAVQKIDDDLDVFVSVLKAERDDAIAAARAAREADLKARAGDASVIRQRFHTEKAKIERDFERASAMEDGKAQKAREREKIKAAREQAALEKKLSKDYQSAVRDLDQSYREKIRVAEEERDAVIGHGDPMTRASLRAKLERIYDNIVSDGRGALSAADGSGSPFDGITANRAGRGSYIDHREMRRFLHFKSFDAWKEYNTKYGSGEDLFGAMMGHVTTMSKEIAARKLLGSNPEREIARLVNFGLKQAALSRPMSLLVPQAAARVGVVAGELLRDPGRLRAIATEMGDLIQAIDKQRYVGSLRRRLSEAKTKILAERLAALNSERIDIMQTGESKLDGLAHADAYEALDAAFDNLLELERSEVLFPRRGEIWGRTFNGTAGEDYARAWANTIENMWDAYTGRMSMPVHMTSARVGRGARNVGLIGKGGSMVLSGLADNFTGMMARRFVGSSAHRAFTSTLKQFSSFSKREATRNGLVAERFLNMHGDGARAAAALKGEVWTNYFADRVIVLSGLEGLTRAQRSGFGMDMQAMFASVAHVSWEALGKQHAKTQRLLKRYGFNEKDWDAIRMGAWAKPHQVDFLSPRLIEDAASSTLADRYLAMILMESDFASPQSMLRAKAAMFGKTRAGTIEGEFIRAAMQFKSFSFMWYMLHMQRAAREFVEGGKLTGVGYAASIFGVMTLGGALVIQLKNIKNGKEPEEMSFTNKSFWARAVLQGGGLGILGDLLQAETNRFGGGALSTFGGPTFGLVDDAFQAITAPVGKPAEAARKTLGYVPGASLWYVSTAYQRLVSDQVQRMLDPEAYKRFRSRELKQRQEYGNGFWWRPGQLKPEFAR